MGAFMEGRQYTSGKKIIKKSKSIRKKLPEIIQERIGVINQLIEVPNDDDPDKPHNWYANKELYKLEQQKRFHILSNLNLSFENLKIRLVDAEMVIAYESFLNQQLLKLHIEGRKALTNIAEHHYEDVELRKKGVVKKNAVYRQQVRNLIEEIGKGAIHQNDYEKFRIKATNLGFPNSTIRKYWLEETGFKSTKKLRIS
jgi:hypothetical protein